MLHHIRPTASGCLQGRFAAPGFDGGVVPGKEHVGHFPAAIGFRAGIVRVIERSGNKRVLDGGLAVAQNAGNEAYDGIGYDEGRKHPAREDVVADRDFVIHKMVGDTLIDALVVPTEQDEVLFVCKIGGERLRKLPALRRHQDHFRIWGTEVSQRLVDRLNFHDHPGATSVGRIVGRAMAVGRPCAQVDGLKGRKGFFLRTLQDAFA